MLGNFNVDLLRHDRYAPTNDFLDSIISLFLPHILQPTRVSSSSKALIDDIFSIILNPYSVSGNLTAIFSDHFPQFVIVSAIFTILPLSKSNIYERNWTNFDYLAEDWNSAVKKRISKSKSFFSTFSK